MTAITPDIVREHGLNDEEYARIKRLLNREPNLVELGVFSVRKWHARIGKIFHRTHMQFTCRTRDCLR